METPIDGGCELVLRAFRVTTNQVAASAVNLNNVRTDTQQVAQHFLFETGDRNSVDADFGNPRGGPLGIHVDFKSGLI